MLNKRWISLLPCVAVGLLAGLLAQHLDGAGNLEQQAASTNEQESSNQQQSVEAPTEVMLLRDVAYREGNDAWKLDLALPSTDADEPRPGIVFVHGGGWRGGDKGSGYFRQGALEYARRGYVCISVNYRLTGEAPFPACVEDVKCAVRWLRAHADEYHLDPKRIGAYGNSAGAHLVAMLGLVGLDAELEGDGPYQNHSSMVQAVCCSATPTDFRNWGREGGAFRGESSLLAGPADTLVDRKALASPITHVSVDAPPFLIIHGTADRTVPIQQSQTFAAALIDAGARDVTLWTLGGEGHGVFGQRAEVTHPAMEQFFARTLRLQPQPVPPAATTPNQRSSQRGGQRANAGRSNAEPSWLMPRIEGPNLHYKTFDSKAVGEPVSYLIYLPPGYEQNAEKRYPVVYWLHGIGGSQEGVPRMAQRLSSAINEGMTPAMIVVYVNGVIRGSYVDSKDGKLPVETVSIKELIPHVDATYRTIATREGRMIEGFSMGGAGAAKWGLRHPEVFGSISIIDGALFSGDPTSGRRSASFQSTYGGDQEYYDAHDPWKLLAKVADQLKGRTTIRIVTRTLGLGSANRSFHEALEEAGVTCEFHAIPDAPHSPNPLYEGLGDRNWPFYKAAFKDALSASGDGGR